MRFRSEALKRILAGAKRGDFSQSLVSFARRKRNQTLHNRQLTLTGSLMNPIHARIGIIPDLHVAHAEALSFIEELFHSHSISFQTVGHESVPHQRVIIHADDFVTVEELLQGHLPDRHWSITNIDSNTLDISINYADPEGHLINQPSNAIRLESWKPPSTAKRDDDGYWPQGALGARSEAGYSVPFIVLNDKEFENLTPSIFSFTKPVDIVYTWVNSDDPTWQQKKQSALERLSPTVHPGSIDDARYASFSELQYSLRSVYTYANWVRKIFIVTDGQVPKWLDPSHPKIEIIDHQQILPDSVFNSHAIESRLHHIEGLSEHYLYLNDDVFFGATSFPEDFFFSESIAKFFPSNLPLDPRPALPDDPPIMAAAKNGRDLLLNKFGFRVHSKLRHSVHPQQRSVARELEQSFPKEFEHVAHSKFRSPDDISVAASLTHWFGYITGRSAPADLEYLYLNLSRSDTGKMLDALYSLRRYQTFCLNQERLATQTQEGITEMQRFLPRYFPYPAPWEL